MSALRRFFHGFGLTASAPVPTLTAGPSTPDVSGFLPATGGPAAGPPEATEAPEAPPADALAEAISANDDLTTERDGLTAQLTAMTSERDRLAAQLAAVTTERDSLSATVTRTRDEITAEIRTHELAALAASQGIPANDLPPAQGSGEDTGLTAADFAARIASSSPLDRGRQRAAIFDKIN